MAGPNRNSWVVLVCAGMAACASARPVADQPRADLNGSWLLNEAESQGAPPDTMPRQPFTVRRVQGGGGGGPIGAPRSITMAVGDMHRALTQLKRAGARLRIVQDDSVVVITSEDTSRLQLRPNGRKTEYYWFGVGQIEARASWQRGALVVERKLVDGGLTIKETYSRAANSARMQVTTEAEGGLVRERRWVRVYDPGER